MDADAKSRSSRKNSKRSSCSSRSSKRRFKMVVFGEGAGSGCRTGEAWATATRRTARAAIKRGRSSSRAVVGRRGDFWAEDDDDDPAAKGGGGQGQGHGCSRRRRRTSGRSATEIKPWEADQDFQLYAKIKATVVRAGVRASKVDVALVRRSDPCRNRPPRHRRDASSHPRPDSPVASTRSSYRGRQPRAYGRDHRDH